MCVAHACEKMKEEGAEWQGLGVLGPLGPVLLERYGAVGGKCTRSPVQWGDHECPDVPFLLVSLPLIEHVLDLSKR